MVRSTLLACTSCVGVLSACGGTDAARTEAARDAAVSPGAAPGSTGSATSAPGTPDGGTGSPLPPAFDRAAVKSVLTRVAEHQLSVYDVTPATGGWIDATFYAGLMAAYKATGKPSLLGAATDWSAANQWDLYRSTTKPRLADNQACVQTYLEIFSLDPRPANAFMYQKGNAIFDVMRAAPEAGRVEWYWCDALFMAPPAMARMGATLGQDEYFDLMNTMYWDTKDFLFSPPHGLFLRDKNFLGTDTFWARGNGWVIAGIPRILEHLPAGNSRRADFVSLLTTMSAALVKLQDRDGGLWRASLLHPEEFPEPETSGSAFITYAMAWGIEHGLLDRDLYLPAVRSAWKGLTANVNAEGRVGRVQGVGVKPAAAAADETHPYGVGAFLLAGSVIARL